MIREYSTTNTFTRCPASAQIVTYLVFLGEALTFFICMYVNFLSTANQITILVLYLVTMIAQIYLTLVTSCSDPSDGIMIKYRNNVQQRFHFSYFRKDLNVENCLYCELCMSYVHESSRHCKVCQRYTLSLLKVHFYQFRCVEKFDHHCMWINNCIGLKNYWYFLAMTTMTFFNLLVYIIGMILLWTEGQWKSYLGSMVTIWVASVFIIIFAIMLINLIGLHIYLIYKGMTTYEFIMLQRQEEKKKKEQEELQAKKSIKVHQNREVTMVPVTTRNAFECKSRQSDEERQPPAINQVEQKNQRNIQNLQKSSDMIFCFNPHQNEEEIQNKTQKSSYLPKKQQNGLKRNISVDKSQNKQEQEPGSLSSKRQNQDNVSQFFTRNKSLKFFIGDEIGSRPKSSKNRVENNDQKQYKSAIIDNIQNKQISFSQTHGKKSIQIPVQKKQKLQKIQRANYNSQV